MTRDAREMPAWLGKAPARPAAAAPMPGWMRATLQPGGHQATPEEKRAAYARYEAVKAEFYAGQAAGPDLPKLLASGQPDGYVSPLMRKIYGL